MKNTELLRNHYISLLSAMIKSKGIEECNSSEDIFSNLRFLAKEKVEFGDEKTSWLDINTKKMLATIIDPDYHMEFKVLERTATEIAVEAKLFWSGDDFPAGVGFVKKSLAQMVTNDADAHKAETEFEALVRGAAATRAFTDAGIGLEFYSDGFDDLFNELEMKEATERIERKKETSKKEFDSAVPSIPSVAEQKAKRSSMKKVKESIEQQKIIESPATLPPQEKIVINNENPVSELETQEITKAVPTLSLDDAKKQIADIGVYQGKSLGLIAETNIRGLVWLIKNNSAVSEAARMIVEDDGRLTQYLN